MQMMNFIAFLTLLITCAVTSGLPVPRGGRSRSRREAEGSSIAGQTVFRLQSLMMRVSDHATLVHKHYCEMVPEACVDEVTLLRTCVHEKVNIVAKLDDPQFNVKTLLQQLVHFYHPIISFVESFQSHHNTSGLCSPHLMHDVTSFSMCKRLESLTNSLSNHLVPYVRGVLEDSTSVEGEGAMAVGHVGVHACDAAMLKSLVRQTDKVLTDLRENEHLFI